jgi:hypothetical protein
MISAKVASSVQHWVNTSKTEKRRSLNCITENNQELLPKNIDVLSKEDQSVTVKKTLA